MCRRAGHGSLELRYHGTMALRYSGTFVLLPPLFRMPPARDLVLLLLTAFTAAIPASGAAQSCRPARTALVLSGGGAKGFAHVGVLRALDSLGQRPDIIVGVSIGAAVGAVYASGYSGRQIDSMLRSPPGGSVLRTFDSDVPASLSGLQPLVVLAEGEGIAGLQTGAVSEPDVNALLDRMLLVGNLRARGDFDSLPIPFRAIAADVHKREPVVLSTGDLARAVRASVAIPVVFTPEYIDGRYLADGGIVANIPVAQARQLLGVERVIVSDVSSTLADTVPLYSTATMLQRMTEYLFEQRRDSLRPEDVLVRHHVSSYASLDFKPVTTERLLKLGRATADSALGAAMCLATLRGNTAPVLRPLPRVVGSVDGGPDEQAKQVLSDLGLKAGDSIAYPVLERRLPYLTDAGVFNAVWLYPSGSGDTVNFSPQARDAPAFYAAGGFAYDLDVGGRIWLAAMYRGLQSLNTEALGVLRLGGLRDEFEFGLRRNRRVRWPIVAPAAILRTAHEDIPNYTPDSTGRLTPGGSSEVSELIAFVGLEPRFRNGWSFQLGGEYRTWWNATGLPDDQGGALAVRLRHFTHFDATRFEAELLYGNFDRLSGELRIPWTMGTVRARAILHGGMTNDGPPQLTFLLGGDEGFPGIEFGGQRGDREVSGQLRLSQRVVGPVEAFVDLAAGRISNGGGELFDSEGWLGGVRLGAQFRSPIGPFQFGFGYATEGRTSLYLRLLRWF